MTDPRNLIYVALDLETTGLSAESDRVIEVGAWRFDGWGQALGTFQSLVNPRRPVGAGAFAVHRIPDSELADQPGAEVVLPAFLAWMDETPGATLLAHNASFDASFLGRELARHGILRPDLSVVDTLALARRFVPEVANYRLDTLALHFGLDPFGPHRALADSERVKGLWMAITGGVPPDPPPPAYPVIATDTPVPSGWGELELAIARGQSVRIEYEGGSRGTTPREITPRAFRHLGGVTYVVARCHLDRQEKSFRLDRVRRFEVVAGDPEARIT